MRGGYISMNGFHLMENDCYNIQTRWNDVQLNQVSIPSFDERWQHIVMHRDEDGFWTIIWDQGGFYPTTITGQDQFGTLTDPYLWIQCDGFYSHEQGAYFDDFVMTGPYDNYAV